MNSPSPINPLSPVAASSKGKSNVRIFVVTIVVLHGVFLGGLLLQGCKKPDNSLAGGGPTNSFTNDLAPFGATNQSPFGADTNVAGIGSPNPAQPLTGATQATGGVAPLQPATEPMQPYQPTQPAGMTGVVGAASPAGTTGTSEYVVKAGDTPAKIAKAHGVNVNALMAANPGLDARKLKVNQKLQLPASASTSGGTAAAPSAGGGVTEPKADTTKPYVVKTGDTLTKIAKAHGVTLKDLRALNGLKTDRINVGQKIKVPAGKAAAPAEATAPAPAPATAAAPAPTVTPTLPAAGTVHTPAATAAR